MVICYPCNVSYLVKGTKSFFQFGLCISVFLSATCHNVNDFMCSLHLSDVLCKHGKELAKIDGAIAVLVHLIDHVLELRLARIDIQAFHHSIQFTRINRSITILYHLLA